jgi:hypothetical protein
LRGHVLVNAGERDGLDVEPGFLAHFSAQPVVDGLAEFQDATGGLPAVVVGSLDQECAAVVVGDDPGHADRVPGTGGVHVITVLYSWRFLGDHRSRCADLADPHRASTGSAC